MPLDLRDMERQALEAQKGGEYGVAIGQWLAIINVAPNWEHGYAHYYLADCYTRTGELDKAEAALRRAVELAPEDEIFSIGLESFLEGRKTGALDAVGPVDRLKPVD